MYSYFCSQGCYNDFANTYVREVIAIAPRTEALETPIDVVKEQVQIGEMELIQTQNNNS